MEKGRATFFLALTNKGQHMSLVLILIPLTPGHDDGRNHYLNVLFECSVCYEPSASLSWKY